ncbi:serine protease [Knoellia subterranea KCTC 19937]|uniref:Serine protease n=1 Tax=Knoellia subterranea KCTC 19937 TaxID=1385521 RepID=A0A0A0JJ99_9MICO|nr:serine protease [Knoellia subterranea KCTC 19937]
MAAAALTALTAVTIAPAAADPSAAPSAAPSSDSPGRVQGADNPDAIPGEYIVVLKDQKQSVAGAKASARSMAAKHGGTVRHTYGTALDGYSAKMSAAQAARVAADPAVARVEQAFRVEAIDSQSNPPSWGLDRIDQADTPLNSRYDYPSNAGQGVHVYIVDSGVNLGHSEFTGRTGSGYDFVDYDSNPADCNGHGTHVAGTAAGTRYGVAKKATVHAVRVLDCDGSGSNADIIAGIDWVRANAIKPAVVNYSIGCSSRCSSTSMDNAVSSLLNSGVMFVQAGGNGNDDACYYSPQHVNGALTIGNSTSSDAKASSSAWGSCVDLFAPGTSITSAWYTSSTAYNTISGTSMASPHVAGAVALYLGANPSATTSQVASAIINNAEPSTLTGIPSGTPNRLLNTEFLLGGTTPGPTPTGCTGMTSVRSGSLSNGQSTTLPYFYDGTAGTITVCLDGPTGTDFDVVLQRWNGSTWSTVARGETPSPDERFTYSNSSGYYQLVVSSWSGSGSFTAGVTY